MPFANEELNAAFAQVPNDNPTGLTGLELKAAWEILDAGNPDGNAVLAQLTNEVITAEVAGRLNKFHGLEKTQDHYAKGLMASFLKTVLIPRALEKFAQLGDATPHASPVRYV